MKYCWGEYSFTISLLFNIDYFSIRPMHTQTFHYFTSTAMSNDFRSVKLILLNEYCDDDDAYYTEHRQRQRRSAHSKHNGLGLDL